MNKRQINFWNVLRFAQNLSGIAKLVLAILTFVNGAIRLENDFQFPSLRPHRRRQFLPAKLETVRCSCHTMYVQEVILAVILVLDVETDEPQSNSLVVVADDSPFALFAVLVVVGEVRRLNGAVWSDDCTSADWVVTRFEATPFAIGSLDYVVRCLHWKTTQSQNCLKDNLYLKIFSRTLS